MAPRALTAILFLFLSLLSILSQCSAAPSAPGGERERTSPALVYIPASDLQEKRETKNSAVLPLVINTWKFTDATDAAWRTLVGEQRDILDAVVEGCSQCERDQCDGTVGFGGSPDTLGETTLDAMIMDGRTHAVGAVAYLRRIKDAIKVARAVMDHSAHSLLVGEGATSFARMLGFPEESLSTSKSIGDYEQWRARHCQPNYYRDFINQGSSCPPYNVTRTDKAREAAQGLGQETNEENHDTVGMVIVDAEGNIAGKRLKHLCRGWVTDLSEPLTETGGTSSNGANHKIAGRVGDSPIPGSGCYVDNEVGGAAATGDGDVMMRFLPSYQAVENMRQGMTPEEACRSALLRIAKLVPSFKGGLVCADNRGNYGAAGYGWTFSYSVRSKAFPSASKTFVVDPLPPPLLHPEGYEDQK